MIHFLLKKKGLTINGVKNILSSKNIDRIDPDTDFGVYKHSSERAKNIKDRLKKITKIISDLKKIK